MFRNSAFLICFCLSLTSIMAQNHTHLQTLPQSVFSQQFQPANLGLVADSLQVQVGIQGAAFLQTNAFSVSTLMKEGNYISNETKESVLDKMPNAAKMSAGWDGDIAVNFRAANRIWGVYGGIHSTTYAQANRDLVGLIFRGNTHYAGKNVTDEGAHFQGMKTLELGVGTAGKWNNMTWGLRIKGIGVLSRNFVEARKFEFFTSEFGDSIALRGEYEYFHPLKSQGLQGGGAALEGGMMLPLASGKMELGLGITDLGLVSVKGMDYDNKVDVKYVGFDLKDLLKLDSLNQDNAVLDSLRNLVFPDSAIKKQVLWLPTSLNLSALYRLNVRNEVFGVFHFSPIRQTPSRMSPFATLGYRHHFKKILTLGTNVSYSGSSGVGVGAFALATFRIKQRFPLQVYYEMDNISGLMGGKGIHAAAGVSWGM